MSKEEILRGYEKTEDLRARRGLHEFTVGRSLTELIIDNLHGFDGMRFCDLGCGFGVDAAAVQKQFPNAQVFGIDTSEGMIDAAKREDDRIHFSVGNISSLPEGELFDRILVRHVLHLTPDAKHAIEDTIARLAPQGRAIFVLHSKESQPKFAEWIQWACDTFHVSYTSAKDDFSFEEQANLFQGKDRIVTTKLIEQKIQLTSPEPYTAYISTQKRWSRPLTDQELQELLAHVQDSINSTLENNGVFEESTYNGLVIVDRV